ncbi:AraC family transcriptional regulator [Mesorhizobium loti]|nr:AraC family transcriptional regulator [Mesorhizobium loti]
MVYPDPRCIRRSRHQTFVRQHQHWEGVRAELIKRTGLERQETHLACSGHVFVLNLAGSVSRGQDVVDGRRLPFRPRRPGSVIYIPAGSDWRGWDEGDAIAAYLLVSVDQRLAEEIFDEKMRQRLPSPAPCVGFRDSAVETALQRIAMEVAHPDPLSVTMAESQAMQLIVQMTRLNAVPGTVLKGGLSSFDLRHVLEMIEFSDKPPTPTELANAVGLSRFHFWRAFKQSTGMTPYAYMAKRRLEKASVMLRTTTLSATEIAMACHFATPSHFTTVFKRDFGITPTEFRRLCRI